jgi:S1-C subfamily serine protease
MKDFKIIVPGDEENEIDATFLGRDERSGLSFVAVKDPSKANKWTPVKFDAESPAPVPKVGDMLVSVGLLPKSAGYKSYLMLSRVSAELRGPMPQVLVSGEGLAAVGSPVFDASGRAVGLVHAQADQNPMLNPATPAGRRGRDTGGGDDFSSVLNPPRLFVPSHYFVPSLKDPPSADKPLVLPWTGISQLSGLKKEVADYYGLKNEAAVQVGDVIAGAPAEKAGIKSGDVIVKLNGQPLERGDSPDETWRIMVNKIMRMKVGSPVTFSVLSSNDKPPRDVSVTLGERPKPSSRAPRFYAEDLGFTVRDLVFEDTYERKLAQDTPGAVIAFVKRGSSAQNARLQNGDLVNQFNGQPVKNVEDFKTLYEAFRKDKPHEALVLEVLRDVNTQVIRIEPPQ